MRADFLILQICEFLDDGDGYYRLHEPSRQLGRLPGVMVVDCHYYHHLLPLLTQSAHVLILPFLHDWDLFPLIEQRRATGRVTVFEANDDFYDVQPWSPIAAQWQDRSIQEEYRHYMAAADAVQTSTARLAERWSDRARQVAVFMNQLTDIPPLGTPPSRPLTIGWGGSPSHFADWYEIAPVLEQWLGQHPHVHLAVMNNEYARPFIQLAPERYHFTPFGSLADYLHFLPTLDIGLAPLLPTGYNRGRSDVKFLEYASRGVAGIYADLDPYRASVRHGETGLIYRTPAELGQCLDRLAQDADLRQRIRTQAYQHVAGQRRISNHIGERLAFYRSLLTQPLPPVDLPEEVAAAALRDERYWQLRPGRLEQRLLEILQKPKAAEAAGLLARLVEENPNYLHGLQQLGRLLNDLKQPAQALPYLERLRSLNPLSARCVAEIGRARFQLQDLAGARKEMEAALALNPAYHPGWQYMLRLLSLDKRSDGPSWAERARKIFPNDFVLALLGVRAYAPAEAVAVVQQLLEEFAPTFTREEKPTAAVAFGEALAEIARSLAAPSAELLKLLHRAVELFPDSARLTSLLGKALHDGGQFEASNAAYFRALEIRRLSSIYRSEFPKEDGSIHFWQFAEHIRKWRGLEPGNPGKVGEPDSRPS
jgi:tetratricopeptide (TPR) repeat protein